MSAFKLYKFQELSRIEQHLNGAVRGGKDPRVGYQNLIGLTLIFSKPSALTVTFTRGVSQSNNPNAFSFDDVKAQIEAAFSNAVKVYCDGPELVLMEASPATGVIITGGTALGALGFATGVTGRVYSDLPTVDPHFVDLVFANGSYVLTVKE